MVLRAWSGPSMAFARGAKKQRGDKDEGHSKVFGGYSGNDAAVLLQKERSKYVRY